MLGLFIIHSWETSSQPAFLQRVSIVRADFLSRKIHRSKEEEREAACRGDEKTYLKRRKQKHDGGGSLCFCQFPFGPLRINSVASLPHLIPCSAIPSIRRTKLWDTSRGKETLIRIAALRHHYCLLA